MTLIEAALARVRKVLPSPYDYKVIWGNSREAQGPLELRRHKLTDSVGWRYNGSGWSKKSIPAEIARLFE